MGLGFIKSGMAEASKELFENPRRGRISLSLTWTPKLVCHSWPGLHHRYSAIVRNNPLAAGLSHHWGEQLGECDISALTASQTQPFWVCSASFSHSAPPHRSNFQKHTEFAFFFLPLSASEILKIFILKSLIHLFHCKTSTLQIARLTQQAMGPCGMRVLF